MIEIVRCRENDQKSKPFLMEGELQYLVAQQFTYTVCGWVSDRNTENGCCNGILKPCSVAQYSCEKVTLTS